MRLRQLITLAPLIVLCFLPAVAQIPSSFTNLKVLPKDISKKDLMAKMKAFSVGLKVRCQHCHIGQEGKPLSTFDFVSDENPHKEVARKMLQMTEQINKVHLAGVGKPSTDWKVTCQTCHRGSEKPTLDD